MPRRSRGPGYKAPPKVYGAKTKKQEVIKLDGVDIAAEAAPLFSGVNPIIDAPPAYVVKPLEPPAQTLFELPTYHCRLCHDTGRVKDGRPCICGQSHP